MKIKLSKKLTQEIPQVLPTIPTDILFEEDESKKRKLNFKKLMRNDVNETFLNLNDFAEEITINGKTVKAIISPVEYEEIELNDYHLPQTELLSVICDAKEVNLKGLSKISIKGKVYNLIRISSTDYLHKLILESVQ